MLMHVLNLIYASVYAKIILNHLIRKKKKLCPSKYKNINQMIYLAFHCAFRKKLIYSLIYQ